jgi:hypothetical protein
VSKPTHPSSEPVQSSCLDEVGAARYLCVATGTLRNWRSQCCGPRYARLGRRVVYRRADLDNYLNACLVEAQ